MTQDLFQNVIYFIFPTFEEFHLSLSNVRAEINVYKDSVSAGLTASFYTVEKSVLRPILWQSPTTLHGVIAWNITIRSTDIKNL